MSEQSLVIAALGFVAILVYSMAERRVSENERLAVFRRQRVVYILGPGTHFITPFVHKTYRFHLDTVLPDWRSLSEPEINDHLMAQCKAQGY